MFDGIDLGELNLPVTDFLNPCVISLPIHTEFTEEELQYIVENFLNVIETLRTA
jgi:dTDP-4-amino-4,6-dideoxygalactose transaminase